MILGIKTHSLFFISVWLPNCEDVVCGCHIVVLVWLPHCEARVPGLGSGGGACGGGCGRGGYETLHPTPHTQHPTPYTLHPKLEIPPITLHPAPFALRRTSWNLHPTPHTPHPTGGGKAARLRQRTQLDLQMMRETGFCQVRLRCQVWGVGLRVERLRVEG